MVVGVNAVIAVLQVLFVFMSFTVELEYCHAPLDPTSTTPLVRQSIEYAIEYNPLFHARPEWMVKATCIHAYWFWMVYSLIFFLAVTDGWARWHLVRQVLLPVLLGCKINAILFCHYMEFTSDLPPPSIAAYFGAECYYLLSIGLVFYKLVATASSEGVTTKEGKQS
mmetsp:Transcript_29/g.76  ORF Transcript_29/g.76 Transcript_29/m.76 type:complete len:167 (-) Transcript_29:492-992(-)|eukprot:CAMPEP_0201125842 /NCGR_PEP_ID=MMETSP0850-20130426/23397_1 /ASSEMBLY_ACC=CAM_ASM_000622 /TAXON_ID=183588 /ORGANISM="Pseudo-nitzschia fraudulenta, Strain WWA7" /LENGTH=166 /DNA_ID=CAMNT_0047394015 /DNA_START=263 /DNA_END=766 /DNA_ORIENTATION=-